MTEFGIFNRILRVEREIKQKDMAKVLGVSTSYLSSIEVGRRPIRQETVKKIISKYNLDVNETAKIWEAYYNSGFNIRFNLNDASYKKATLMRLIKKDFEDIDDETAEKIIEIIKDKGCNNEKREHCNKPVCVFRGIQIDSQC